MEFFYFRELEKEKNQKEIHKLKINKASQHSDIHTKIIKSNLFSDFLYVSINSSVNSSLFPSCLKTADITPIYKKDKEDWNYNYRPVSILPVLLKSYERICSSKYLSFFKIFSEKTNWDLGKITAREI